MQRAESGGASESKVAKASSESMEKTSRMVLPFSLSGVQRQVKVGKTNDPAEHEANRVADHVTSGGSGAKATISRLQLLQRQTQDPSATSVHRAATEEVKKAEESKPGDTATVHRASSETKTETPVQRAAADDSQVKRAGKPEDASVQRAAADDSQVKRAGKPEDASVQRAAADDSQVKRAGKPEDASVQRAAADDSQVKRAGKPEDASMQRAAADEKTGGDVHRAEESHDAVHRSCCGGMGDAWDHRPSGTATVLCKFQNEPSGEGVLHRKAAAVEEPVHRKEIATMDHAAEHAISTKDAGVPLRPEVRHALEARMGADFGGVRVHEGPQAHQSAAAIHARAFTYKNDIWLGRGESQDNLSLMAHEATHVVQQGAAVKRATDAHKHDEEEKPVVRRSAWDTIKGIAKGAVDAAGNVIAMGADAFWSLAKKVAPSWVIDIIEGIRSKGIVGYLRDKVSGAFNGIFGGLGKDSGGFIAGMMQTFSTLLSTAHEIIGALGRGDCQPLFDAVGKLGNALKEMAGAAWDKVKAFFAPIGDFFSGLWKKFGAPVVDFLGDVAADIWNDIKALGQKIWDGTQPIRDALSAAWKWIKDQLGIGDEPEGQNGLLQWVQKKLGEAWDWFKEKLQPIIGPMQAMVDKIKAIIPLDKILHLRDTVHEWLQHATQMVTNMRKPKDVTKNQEALRGQILPAVKAAIVGLKGKIAGAGSWIAEQIGGIAQTVNGLFSSLRSNPILGKLSGAISWVQDKITSLSNWVQGGVVGLFTTIGNGVAKLADFIEPVLNVLKKIVSVIVNIVKELPGLVLGPVWKAIPACIRDPIKDFIIENILSQIPIISTFLKVPEIWSKIQKLVMDFLAAVFVNGDLSGAALMVIRFVLEAAGINFDLMLSVLGKAASALDDIIMHPVQFLQNLGGAVAQGLNQFVKNIGKHLVTGLVNWLVGPLKDLGVAPIKDLSLESILGLVLGILGITEAKLRQKAEKAVGPKALKVLEAAWKWIKALITGGIGGLWKEIKDQLSNLWSSIIGGITQWITVELVEVAVAKLIKMCNPVGAVIEAIQTIYKAVSFFVQKANEILALVDAVLTSIQQIVAGAIGPAANWIEQALARTIPTVLAFFAKWLGISDPGPKIHDIVKKIQGTVEGALDWLVDKAIAIGKKIAGVLGLGGKKEKPEDHDAKWTAGVAGVKKELAAMEEKGIAEGDIEAAIPGWKTTYGFETLTVKESEEEWEIDGGMSDGGKVATEPRPGSKGHPFSLDWPKPAAAGYRDLYFGGKVAHRTQKYLAAHEGQEVGGEVVEVFHPTSQKKLPGSNTTIGLTSKYQLHVGSVIGPLSDAETPGGGTLNSVLKEYGFSPDAEYADADHVQEIQFGGPNTLGNLWPLNASVNRGAGSSLSKAPIKYPAPSTRTTTVPELKSHTSRKYYFKLTGFGPDDR